MFANFQPESLILFRDEPIAPTFGVASAVAVAGVASAGAVPSSDPRFLLDASYIAEMQRYVNGVLSLPALPAQRAGKDANDATVKLYTVGRALQSKSQEHARDWRDHLYPSTVDQAKSIAQFAAAAADKLGALVNGPASSSAELMKTSYIHDIAPELLRVAQANVAIAQQLEQRVVLFAESVRADSASAQEIASASDILYAKLPAELKNVQAQMRTLQSDLQHAQREYDKSVKVAASTVSYVANVCNACFSSKV
jgi:hypothetical protein